MAMFYDRRRSPVHERGLLVQRRHGVAETVTHWRLALAARSTGDSVKLP